MERHEILSRVVSWAERDDNIRAVVLTGSTARDEGDQLSDLDVELYVTHPESLLDDDSWYAQFGTLLAVEALPNPGWHPTRLLYLAGGKIDFMVAPIAAIAMVSTVHERPFRVLVDKDAVTVGLSLVPPSTVTPPPRDAFLECVNWFFAATIMGAKCVVRGEPWMAKFRDWDGKNQLLRMIEWDHRARYGWTYDTWFNGKHLDSWMDPEIRSALENCWAGFSLSEQGSALVASLNLFALLSRRTAPRLGFAPPDCDPVQREVSEILSMRPISRR